MLSFDPDPSSDTGSATPKHWSSASRLSVDEARGCIFRPQRLEPKPTGPTETLLLPIETIHPMIRLAHRRTREMNIPPRIIVDHEVVLVTEGTATLHRGGERVGVHAGSLILIRPFELHAFKPNGVASHYAIHFDLREDVPPRTAALQDRTPYEVRLGRGHMLPGMLQLGVHHRAAELTESCVAMFERGDDLSAAEASSLLLQLLLMVIREAKAQSAPMGTAMDRRLRDAVAYLEAHLDEPLTPHDLARAAGLSESHFRRVFRTWAHRSVMTYVNETRVTRARKLLAEPDASIKEVARRVGFADPYHFSRVFRRIDGLSPSQFRAAALADQHM